MGTSDSSHIMTLVNSIIGVSILAMPFCYKQCGILLASLILIFSNLMTRLSCHYLLKSAIMTRRRSYEMLAFHALGSSGKTIVELSIILLMIGTCVAFFVVMGDLGPAIVGPLLQVNYSAALRPAVLIGLAIFVVLPLGLLRNVDSLSSICTASFLFYLLLVGKVFIESMDNLFFSPWTDEVHLWRPAGILQCLPIFSMALSCQSQLLEIFDSVQNGTLDKMNSIVKSAVNLCTALYMSVGFLGYIAYHKTSFGGNLLMSFSASNYSEFIKLGFVLSVAVTFPMVIFPCRTSLHSLLFKKVHTPHYELVSGGGNHIPEAQFKCITFFIITVSLIVGLLAPNIEIVLGLLGSTIGVIICILCPPFIFMWISNKATTEKALARIMCVFGLFIMVMGTYANLYLSDSTSSDSTPSWKNLEANIVEIPAGDIPAKHLEEKEVANVVKSGDQASLEMNAKNVPKERKVIATIAENEEIVAPKISADKEDKRVEPPIPQYPEARKASPEEKESIDVESKKNVEVNKVGSDKKMPQNTSENAKVREQSAKSFNHSRAVKSPKKLHKVPKSADDIKKDFKPVELQAPKSKQDNVVAALNAVQKLVEEQPPLPLLVKAHGNSDTKEKLAVHRDVPLDKPVVVDREKRDLNYVTNLTEVEAFKTVDTSNSFIQKVAEKNSVPEVCEKDQNVAVDEAKRDTAGLPRDESFRVDGKAEKFATVSTETKNDNVNNLRKSDGKVANQSTKPKNDDANSAKSDGKVFVRETKPEKDETSKMSDKITERKKNLILSPSKLTDPVVELQEELSVDERKPGARPMSRELKTIGKETGNRKK